MMQMEELYKELWNAHGDGKYTILDQSLNPRSSDMMFDLVDEFGIHSGGWILDAGSGPGERTCVLASRYNCRVIGLEPAQTNLALGRTAAVTKGVSKRVSFVRGVIESIPSQDNVIDLVWCRDMLVHVADVETGILECARVLKPGAPMIVMVTLATDLLFQGEVERLFQPLGIFPRSLSREVLEESFKRAGLEIVTFELIGGERLEYFEERMGTYSREMMRLARMIRNKERFVDQLGEHRFQIAKALYYWSVYLLIGKLADAIYVLR
jgi:ubiquinone/menaquinone biosynthesis C-methylase UbiE